MTTERTLRLLGLLQSRAEWPAQELADRLETTRRTLRRDVTRLKELGYEVESRPGPGGHYTLRTGGRVPPLLLEPDEAVAMVAALRMAESRLTGDAARRALTKLDRLVPPGRTAGTLRATTIGTEVVQRDVPDVDAEAMEALTRAGAQEREAEFDYVDHVGIHTHRHVDTVRCIWSRGHWYVVAWDLDRHDWRVFRLDRVSAVTVGRRRDHPRPWVAEDLVIWFETDFGRRSQAT